MSKAEFQCQDFDVEKSINGEDLKIDVAASPIGTGIIGTHSWLHACAQEQKRKMPAIYCHDVTECTFVVLTSRVRGEYPLSWSFHAPPGSLPGSTGLGTVSVSIQSFYNRVAKESGRLKYRADFDLIVVGIEAYSIDVNKIATELSKNTGVKSVRPLVHHVTGYKCEMFTVGELIFHEDGTTSGNCQEHTCYDIYFFPTLSIDNQRIVITEGKGKNQGIQNIIKL